MLTRKSIHELIIKYIYNACTYFILFHSLCPCPNLCMRSVQPPTVNENEKPKR